MAPPTYGDLGKSARDVFGKGYHFGLIKLEAKTKTESGIEFTTGGTSALDSGKVNGSFESKYRCKDYGLTFTEKWNTDNQLNTIVDVQDQIVRGLKLTLDTTFVPATQSKSGKVKAEMKHDMFTFNSDVDLNTVGPVVNASAVVGHNGVLAGYRMAFDTGKSKLTKNHFGLGYSTGDMVAHMSVADGKYDASLYNKCAPNMESGVQLGWSSKDNVTSFGVACKYNLDKDASIRAKVNNSSIIGLGYQQQLRKGVKLTLSTLIDGKNFNQGGHKLGACLEMEA